MRIFQNENIIILNKPAGYATQGGQDLDSNLFTLLISNYERSNIFIMHRLDLPCTGVVMFGKCAQASKRVQQAITERKSIHKFYLAKTMKKAPKDEGLIDCHVDWNDNKRKSRLSSPTIPSSQTALTFYKWVGGNDEIGHYYLVKLLTGRKHQIRCHFADYLQAPIINDTLYGAPKSQKSELDKGIYLHSFTTVITDPQIRDKVFNGQVTSNDKGSVSVHSDYVYLRGSVPWLDQRGFPDESKLQSIIARLLEYQPRIAKGKYITY